MGDVPKEMSPVYLIKKNMKEISHIFILLNTPIVYIKSKSWLVEFEERYL